MGGNGHVIPNTPIAVDFWHIKKYPTVKCFFLTHFHSDHIMGLSSSWEYPIYTSPITARLLIRKLKINPDLVHELELEKTKLLPLDNDGKEMLSVTAIDANHCPGSVMFLFSGYFGNILYTGDFRYSEAMFSTVHLPVIDVLYLDNTYCSRECDFYSREYATSTIIERLQNCLKTSDRVMLGVDNLGKEELMTKIAENLNIKICVEEHLMEILHILELSDIATTNPKNCKVFAINISKVNKYNMIKWNKLQTTCAIIATARYTGLGFMPFTKHSNVHVIPYSNHSSFLELQEFVKKVHPCNIEPIVNKNSNKMMGIDVSSRSDMSVFLEFTNMFASKAYTIPESVKKYMQTPFVSGGLQHKRKIRRLEPRIVLCRYDKGVDFINSCGSGECNSLNDKRIAIDGNEASCVKLVNSNDNDEDDETALNNNDNEQEMVSSTCTSNKTWELLHITSFEPTKINILSGSDIKALLLNNK